MRTPAPASRALRTRPARYALAAVGVLALCAPTSPALASPPRTAMSAGDAVIARAQRTATVAASPAEILGYYNALRSENGIPGDLALDSASSADCALQDHYAALNGYDQPNPHHETPGKPGYTSGGDWAAHNSELSGGSTLISAFDHAQTFWSAPFLLAPFHLMGLLNPANTTLWGADSEGQLCIGETGDRPAPATDTLYSFPGNGTSIAWAEPYPNEWPTSPEAVAGIPTGTVTGPVLMVYWQGPSDDNDPPLHLLDSATLTGPGGPVSAQIVNAQQSSLVPSGAGFIIPTSPLTPGARYTATVSFSNSDLATAEGVTPRSWSDSFSFTASGPASPGSLVRISAVAQPHNRVTFVTAADFPAAGEPARLTVTSSNSLLRIAGGNGYLPSNGTLSVYPLPAPEPGGWLRLSYVVPAYTVGGVNVPAVTVSKKISGPPLRTLLTGLKLRRSYSVQAVSASGIRLALRVKQPRTVLQAGLELGHLVYAASQRVRTGRSGRVTLTLRASAAQLGALLGGHRSRSVTLGLRVAEPGRQQFEIDRRLTLVR